MRTFLLPLQWCRHAAAAIVPTVLFTASSFAAVDVAPGETSAPLQADGCQEASGSIVGDCLVGCLTSCDLAQNTANCLLDVTGWTVGNKFASTTVYTDFTVTAGDVPGTVLDGSISYDLEWAGGWTLGGVFTGFNDVQSVMTITLTDQSDGGKVVGKSTFHTMTTDGFIGIDIIDVGAGLDQGTESNTLTARLIRGHTYRVGLTVRCEGIGALNATVILDYLDGGWGLWWNDLSVSVGVDMAEEIAKLRRDLENHTHTYRTGRGEGHNNTEAETSPAVFLEEDSVTADELEVLPDDAAGLEPLPIQSVLLASYPNPFNPAATISYTIPVQCDVSIKTYNVMGQLVRTLVSENQTAGEHTVTFDASELSSGVYFYRLIAGGFVETRRMTLVK